MNTVATEQIHSDSADLSTNVLESVRIEGQLRDLACELTVTQAFRNESSRNIEAVYTFPLPHGAVLLDLVAKIGDRELRGSVLPKAKAEERYEKAITEGDGAIMLERSNDGICTVNFGNLMPGERATLTYQYAYLLSWQQDTVKFRLPMTIAPRYGDPIAAGYQPHQVPGTSVLAENRYSLQLNVEGVLAAAMFDCPSHRVSVQHKNGNTSVALNGDKAWMDRDFVLDMKLSGVDKASAQTARDHILNGNVGLASFCPQFPGGQIESICAKIVVDCSGSMNGDSIEQAKAGLHRILDNLRETDTFNVVRFGSDHRAYFPDCVCAKGRSLRNARQEVDRLQADLGGTEMGSALDFTYELHDDGLRPQTILLITDGEIEAHREVIRKAIKSGHRIFTVGVGSAVAEEFVRGIADKTGGACELVTPNEGMAEAIYRQFRRMSQPRAIEAKIEWPGEVAWQSPAEVGPVFGGDTLHVYAGLSIEAKGEVKLVMKLEDGREVTQGVNLSSSEKPWEALPRIATAARIDDLDKERPALAEELSNQYQLVTKHTNYLILDIKAEDKKASDLPELAKVTQMLAAGWSGVSSVRVNTNVDSTPMVLFSGRRQQADSIDLAYGATPQFSRKQKADAPVKFRRSGATDAFRFSNSDADELDGFAPSEMMEKEAQLAKLLPIEVQTNAIKDIIKSGTNWYSIFVSKLLPELPASLNQMIKELKEQESWSDVSIASSLLLVMMRELGMEVELEASAVTFEAAADSRLIRYFQQGLTKDDFDFTWKSRFDLLPSSTV